MVSIGVAAQGVRDDAQAWINQDLVTRACEAAGHVWRDRVLAPWATLQLFALQVMWGNLSCRAVTRLSERAFSKAAYCAARMRLPVDVLVHVAAQLTGAARQRVAFTSGGFGRWNGHRLLHIDGTGLSMPDTPGLQRTFGRPGGQKPGCGFPPPE